MTAAQRSCAINRHNARKSTGPKTAEGKERTRQNALKHGLCAEQLVLPIEKAEDLQNQFDEWVEQYQPVGIAEFALVEEIVKNQLRLSRCAGRETAVLDLQVRAAYRGWNNEQEDRLAALRQVLAADPAKTVRALSRFGAGRRWMIDRWRNFARWIERDGYCKTPALVDEAVHLLGGDSKKLKTGPVVAYQFRLCCSGSRPTPDPKYVEWLLSDATIHPDHHAEYGGALPSTEFCRNHVRVIVAQQIAALEQEDEEWRADEKSEGIASCLRAQIPADGSETRLALRYETIARSALHKALKELDRFQDARYAAEAEAEAADLPDDPPAPIASVARNEADTSPEPQPTPDNVPSCDASENTNSATFPKTQRRKGGVPRHAQRRLPCNAGACAADAALPQPPRHGGLAGCNA